jgi:hypothetical protein
LHPMKAFLKKRVPRSMPFPAAMSKMMVSQRYKMKLMSIYRRVSITRMIMITMIFKSIITLAMKLTEFMKGQNLETLMMSHTYKSQKLMNIYLTSLKNKNMMLKRVMVTNPLIKICRLKLTIKRNSITIQAKLTRKKLNSKEDSHLPLIIHHYLKIRLDYSLRMLHFLLWILIQLN